MLCYNRSMGALQEITIFASLGGNPTIYHLLPDAGLKFGLPVYDVTSGRDIQMSRRLPDPFYAHKDPYCPNNEKEIACAIRTGDKEFNTLPLHLLEYEGPNGIRGIRSLHGKHNVKYCLPVAGVGMNDAEIPVLVTNPVIGIRNSLNFNINHSPFIFTGQREYWTEIQNGVISAAGFILRNLMLNTSPDDDEELPTLGEIRELLRVEV